MKIAHIALREFLATVATKGFLIGLLLFPAIITAGAALGPRFLARFFNPPLQKIEADLAVVDPTAVVAPEPRARHRGELPAARRQQMVEGVHPWHHRPALDPRDGRLGYARGASQRPLTQAGFPPRTPQHYPRLHRSMIARMLSPSVRPAARSPASRGASSWCSSCGS